MLRTILNQKQSQIVKDEKAALERLQLILAGLLIAAEAGLRLPLVYNTGG